MQKPEINQRKCKKCGVCRQVCPEKAIVLFDGKLVIDAQKCTGCRICVPACHLRAIQ